MPKDDHRASPSPTRASTTATKASSPASSPRQPRYVLTPAPGAIVAPPAVPGPLILTPAPLPWEGCRGMAPSSTTEQATSTIAHRGTAAGDGPQRRTVATSAPSTVHATTTRIHRVTAARARPSTPAFVPDGRPTSSASTSTGVHARATVSKVEGSSAQASSSSHHGVTAARTRPAATPLLAAIVPQRPPSSSASTSTGGHARATVSEVAGSSAQASSSSHLTSTHTTRKARKSISLQPEGAVEFELLSQSELPRPSTPRGTGKGGTAARPPCTLSFTTGDKVCVRSLATNPGTWTTDHWDDFDGMTGIVTMAMVSPFRIMIRLLPGHFVNENVHLNEYDVSLIFAPDL